MSAVRHGKAYLGSAVYVAFDGFAFWLAAEVASAKRI
jgi:hypothetical protein